MTDEPASKRQRLSQHDPAQDDFLATFLPTPAAESHAAYGFDNIDPFLSPATSWGFDEFAHDPNYLASQEELRSLLFTTARSAAPTRAGTPTGEDHESGGISFNVKHVLVKGRRVQYLKNYISQVAPWVLCPLLDPRFTQILKAHHSNSWICSIVTAPSVFSFLLWLNSPLH